MHTTSVPITLATSLTSPTARHFPRAFSFLSNPPWLHLKQKRRKQKIHTFQRYKVFVTISYIQLVWSSIIFLSHQISTSHPSTSSHYQPAEQVDHLCWLLVGKRLLQGDFLSLSLAVRCAHS